MEYENLKEAITQNFPFKNPKLSEDIFKYAVDRLGGYLDYVKLFYVEENYIDSSWRSLFKKHYANTYYQECTKYCVRIHFFRNENQPDDYLGFIILKPIPTVQALGKIVLKPIKEFYKSECVYLLSKNIEINIFDKEWSMSFQGFPVIVQDGVAQVCADACINMVANYLSSKFPGVFPGYNPELLYPNNINRRPIPSYGLTVYEISQILLEAGYRAYIEEFSDATKLTDFIDSQIESGLPVMLVYDGHVSLIMGHINKTGDNKHYVTCDDSGYHLSQYGYDLSRLFSGVLDLSKLDLNQEGAFVIAFDFDKVYLRSNSAGSIAELYAAEIIKQFSQSEDTINAKPVRKLLVEYKYLLNVFTEGEHRYIKVDNRAPHYVWWIEFTFGGIVIDATSHKNDIYCSILGFSNYRGPIGLLQHI